MGRGVIAVIDWRAAAALKENARFFERAGLAGKAATRDPRRSVPRYRSLTIREDGSCELQHWSVEAAARRLGGTIQGVSARKAGKKERG